MTFREICEQLRRGGVPDPEWDAALLIGHFLGVSRGEIFVFPEREYSNEALLRAVSRRAERYPLQYLLGEWSFYRQTYRVTPDCLIPRPDTECLVARAVAELPRNAFFADLCTGSGCIAISTLCERPDTTAVAVDVSPEALNLAKENAERNGVSDRVTFLCADLLAEAHPWTANFRAPDAILANPPYIRSDVLPQLEPELSAEPKIALDGGADGLIFYRSLFRLLAAWSPRTGIGLFEIGYDQGSAMQSLAVEFGFGCRIFQDDSGNDRVARVQR